MTTVPEHACEIWAEGPVLVLSLGAHSVRFTANTQGFAFLTETLARRARHGARRIGEAGQPTQWETDRELIAAKLALDVEAVRRNTMLLDAIGIVPVGEGGAKRRK